ncbi:MAG: hypothetical protein K2M06_04675 [Muribaculaceae bacterium]|nr:hypothetical protein [Muribaculaceae bacterium]
MIAVSEISPEEYCRLFPEPVSAYSTPAFCKLNSWKVSDVKYLCFSSGDDPVAGIIVGVNRESRLACSPFSAPFGGVDVLRELRVEEVLEIYEALRAYIAPYRLRIVLPPDFYSPSNIVRQAYALNALGASATIWLNHSYNLQGRPAFETLLSDKMRQHLRRARRSAYEVIRNPELEEAYEVIRRNREERGYPLAMSLEDMRDTASVIPQEYIVLRHEGLAVAAAISYRPAPGITQLIYWGHLAECKGKYPMIALAREVYDRALESSCNFLDLGPSTSAANPNDSLAAFKESVGAKPDLKYIFEM